jgi:protein-S-isoprenylcysteine O-methyltransferase Ste14
MKTLELKVPPPAVALCLGFLMWLLPAWGGLLDWNYSTRLTLAVLLVLLGQGISVSGMVAFRRAKTTINPVKADAATSLVSSGIYRITRNPMYVGLFITLLAWAAFLGKPAALLVLPLYVAYIHRFQILPEERILTQLFGAEYTAYQQRVRRWL